MSKENTKIVWFGRHEPLPSQHLALHELFPGHELIHDKRSFTGVDDIIARYKEQEADELLVIGHPKIQRELCERGLAPLFAVMVPTTKEEAELVIPKNHNGETEINFWKFKHFSRVNGVKLNLVSLRPNKDGKKLVGTV